MTIPLPSKGLVDRVGEHATFGLFVVQVLSSELVPFVTMDGGCNFRVEVVVVAVVVGGGVTRSGRGVGWP